MGRTATNARPALDFLVGYYLATPVFFLLDAVLGVPLRVPLPEGWSRGVYYVGLLGVAAVCWRRPRLAPWLGMGESAFNLLLVLAAVLVPIWSAPDAVLAGGAGPDAELLMGRVWNAALTGTVLVVAFHQHRLAAGADRPVG